MIDNTVRISRSRLAMFQTSSITINSGDAVGRYTGIKYPCYLQNTLTASLICSVAMLYP